MRIRNFVKAAVLFGAAALTAQQQPPAQEQQAPINVGTVIRTETRQVLVDVVVRDKKDNYVRDLEQKDFKVWEDNKEQSIVSFSYEAGMGSPNNPQKHYLVLFFDNSTMEWADQQRARQAAVKFIDSNSGPNRYMAIANFTGMLQIAQNFTADGERLKQVVNGTKFSSVDPNDQSGPTLGAGGMAGFGQRTMLLALRSLARNMGQIPGRKIMVLLSSGFPLTIENRSELTAAIDSCNRSNVAVYPIDVRGLVPGGIPAGGPSMPGMPGIPGGHGGFNLLPGAGSTLGAVLAAAFAPQKGGTSPGAGSPTGGGSSPGGSRPSSPSAPSAPTRGSNPSSPSGNRGTGTTGNTGNTNNNLNNSNNPNNPYNRSRDIVPQFPPSATTNQQVLFMLAQGTGGFVIVNTNDLLGGLEKIGKEQNEFYLLGYTPAESAENSCHTLRVKVDRSGTEVRARTGYCNVKQVDLLAGKPVERDLETRAAADIPGTIQATFEAPFFYTGAHAARVDVALDIPSKSITFEKEKGKHHADINILGIAYRPDGGVAARFSDTAKLDFADKKQLAAFNEQPFYHYENQFDLAEGNYTLKVVFSSGREQFGKLASPLTIDPYDGKQLFISGVALSKNIQKVSTQDADLDAALLEGRAPLVVDGIQVNPAGTNTFSKTDRAVCYLEVYAPALAAAQPAAAQEPKPADAQAPAKPAAPAVRVGLQYRIVDSKSGQLKAELGTMEITGMAKPGNPVIPVGLKIPVADLDPGAYNAEITVSDSTGRTMRRIVPFSVE